MRPYLCPTGDQTVFFDDLICTACETPLAHRLSTDEAVAATAGTTCANREEIGCSFVVEEPDGAPDAGGLCRSCRLTTVRPPADDADGTAAWADAEAAKRQLLRQCLDLGIDVEGARYALRSSTHEPVITGHEDGLITIDVREADDVVRTRMREKMGEQYRTMLGHVRHETGHYLWMALVDGTDRIEGFREMFGDERADYAAALEQHYGSPDPEGWQDRYVSVYATSHPWEDFAETLAHYFHITDTLDTADSFGVAVDGPTEALEGGGAAPAPDGGAAQPATMQEIIDRWLPLSYGLNALNRSMGRQPAYPFVLAPPVVEKLAWVHDLVTSTGPGDPGAATADETPRRRGMRRLLGRR